MARSIKRFFVSLSPILGAGAVGACPFCWIGSASLLTYLGLGALVPLWQWVVLVLLGIGIIGFIFDYRSHKKIYPLVLLILGGILLYIGRYVFVGPGLGHWPIWGSGSVFIFIAIYYNKKLFTNKKNMNKKNNSIKATSIIKCTECGFEKEEIMPTDSCQFFYECSNCHKRLRPKNDDCCVFCSYGDTKCPSKQAE